MQLLQRKSPLPKANRPFNLSMCPLFRFPNFRHGPRGDRLFFPYVQAQLRHVLVFSPGSALASSKRHRRLRTPSPTWSPARASGTSSGRAARRGQDRRSSLCFLLFVFGALKRAAGLFFFRRREAMDLGALFFWATRGSSGGFQGLDFESFFGEDHWRRCSLDFCPIHSGSER